MDIEALFPHEDREPGASEAEVEQLADHVGASVLALPEDYRQVLRLTNGFDGDLRGDDSQYLRIFSTHDVIEAYDSYDVLEDFEGHVPIGDTGASWFFALNLTDSGERYRLIDSGSGDVLEEASAFIEFLDKQFEAEPE